jgi:murein DD-endopeptidase MepM/ murein hydrolase activator NlpD
MEKLKNNAALAFGLICTLILGVGLAWYLKDSDYFQAQEQAATLAAAPALSLEEAFPFVIVPKTTLFTLLREQDISPLDIQQIVSAAKPLFNLTKLKPGLRFQIYQNELIEKEVREIKFRFSAVEFLSVKKENGTWIANKVTEEVELRNKTFSGTVTSSLWESAQKAEMDPNLIAELADVFAWEVDFSREVRSGDRWRMTVQEKWVKDKPIGWGAILAAEYINAGEAHQAVLFRTNGEDTGYFTPTGESLRKMFLKSPIRYGRITSGFNLKRFHPILLKSRPHLGVDFAAPKGTPIRAVGDGTVLSAGWRGGGGNVVKIRHNSTYATAYKHMSGFARGIRAGAHVQQGQVIGYVGSTGISTGPHCHFEFYERGRFIDPVRKKFPSADPVPEHLLGQFQTEAAVMLASLPNWDSFPITAQETK